MKTIYQITVGDVILLQDTESNSHLKSRWMPLLFVKKELEELAGQIFERLGTHTIEDLENDLDRVLSYRNLQRLEALWKALDIEMNLKVSININLISIGKKSIASPLLKETLDKIKKVTGIEIKTPEDIEKFSKHIEFKNDKHLENYPKPTEEEEEEKKTDFTKIIYSYFNYMDEPYNENMRFLSFMTMKRIADEIALKRSLNG